MQFNLNGLKMNAIQTDPEGVIGAETIFEFSQNDNIVLAEYSGGRIRKGYLVGIIAGSNLNFRYCQVQMDNQLDGGESDCELRLKDGLIQIIENFSWESRQGSGQNIIQQIQ